MVDAAQALPKNYCNVTFLTVGDEGPDGFRIERLLRCSRCQETYYCGREQQRRHWNMHKLVCLSVGSDIQEEKFVNLSMPEVAESFLLFPYCSWDRTKHIGRPFLFLLRRLLVMCCEEPSIEWSELDVASAKIILSMLCKLVRLEDQSIEVLWAIPGITTFLLNLEITSAAMRQRRLAAEVPSDDELLDSVANSLVLNGQCYYIAEMFCVFLQASFAKLKSTRQDEEMRYRNTAGATCAARKLMKLYADPYTRASLPCVPSFSREQLLPFSLFFLIDALPDDPLDNAALVPGLTVHDIFQIIVTEPCCRAMLGDTMGWKHVDAFVLTASSRPKAWEAFSAEARASIAHLLLGIYWRCSDADGYSRDLAHGNLTLLFCIVVGHDSFTESNDDQMWLQVVQLARTPKFGRFTRFFSEWYKRVGSSVINDFYNLFNEIDFSVELIPTPVVDHIIEYAMDPFNSSSQLIHMFALFECDECRLPGFDTVFVA